MDEQEDTKALYSWSATLVRNRAETTLLALLIFTFVNFNADLKQIPLIGVSIDGGIPKGILILALFGFFMYFLTCFVVRYRLEDKKNALTSTIFSKFLTEAHGLLQRLEGYQFPNYGDFNARLSQDDRIASIQREFESVRHLRIDLDRTIDRARQTADKPEFLQNFIENVRVYVEANNSYELNANERLEQTRNLVENYRTALNDYQTNMEKTIVLSAEKLAESESTLRNGIIFYKKEIQSVRRIVGWDRTYLGIYLPMAFSVLLVVISFYQAGSYVSATWSEQWTFSNMIHLQAPNGK